MIPFHWFIEARERISPYIKTTPLTYDKTRDLYIKWENQQITGSFKARGAFNKILGLQPWEQQAGLLAASAGNHGQGVALAGKQVGAPVQIFAAASASPSKIEAMQLLGAEVTLIPGGYGDAEKAALKAASEGSATWISPYNDGQIIAGQGTIALEVFQQAESLYQDRLENATWLVPTSGGGLLAGIAQVVQQVTPDANVIGVQSDTSPFMHALFHRGSQEDVVELPTLADGLSGPVEQGSITIPIVRQYVHDILLVTEDEIEQAIAYAWHHDHQIIEGSAAVVLAAILTQQITRHPMVAIVSGGNIQESLVQKIIGERS